MKSIILGRARYGHFVLPTAVLALLLLLLPAAGDVTPKGTGLTLSDDVFEGDDTSTNTATQVSSSSTTTSNPASVEGGSRAKPATTATTTGGSTTVKTQQNAINGAEFSTLMGSPPAETKTNTETDVPASSSLTLFKMPLEQTAEDEKLWDLLGYWKQGGNATVLELQQLSDGGDVEATYNLGIKYLLGLEITQDTGKARELFATAAATGYAHAQSALALFYSLGFGVEDFDIPMSTLYHSFATMNGGVVSDMALGYQYFRSQRYV